MIFTEWVSEVEPAPERRSEVQVDDARELGRMLRQLHDQLRPFDGQLAGLRALGEEIERLLSQILPTNAHRRDAISSLGDRLNRLTTTVVESDLPTQALHGDVSLRNLLRTPRRLLRDRDIELDPGRTVRRPTRSRALPRRHRRDRS